MNHDHLVYIQILVWFPHSHLPTLASLSGRVSPLTHKKLILLSTSNLGFSDGMCGWTICACCQVCVKISSTPVALMAVLWIVTKAMVKCGQAGDVQRWVHPREIVSVCVYFEMRSKSSPALLSSPFFSGSCEAVWTEGHCQKVGELWVQHPAFSQSHLHSII